MLKTSLHVNGIAWGRQCVPRSMRLIAAQNPLLEGQMKLNTDGASKGNLGYGGGGGVLIDSRGFWLNGLIVGLGICNSMQIELNIILYSL